MDATFTVRELCMFLLMACLIVLVIFLWVLADILMYKGILPGVDLGYSWFNGHLFQLFPYS